MATSAAHKPAANRAANLEEPITRKHATRLFEMVASNTGRTLREVRSTIIPESSWKRAGATLPPSATQSTLRLERVLKLAQSIWQNEKAATNWLNTPHPELGGQTPFSLLKTEAGGRIVEDLLIALEHGFAV